MSPLFSSSRRHLTTAAASSVMSGASAVMSGASARAKLQKTFDPDYALSIISSSNPDSSSSRFALDLAVRRLCRSRRFSDVKTLLQSRLDSRPDSKHDEPFLSTLILTYGTASMLDEARQLFDQIPQPTTLSFNALLSAQIKSKKAHNVPKLFTDVPAQHTSIHPDEISYGILIKSFCLTGKAPKAFEAFNTMKESGLKPTTIVYTTLIDCFYKKGMVEEARKLWEEMVGEGLKPDLAAYNVKAMHPSKYGSPEEVREVMKEMEEVGLTPDAISHNYLINCYCRNGRFEEAKEAYREFVKKRIDPNASIYKMLVKALCENGDFDGALEVCRDSFKKNKIPEFKTMSALVKGLFEGGKVEEAKEVIAVIKGRFPDNQLGGWKKLEKALDLCVDAQVAEPVETA